MFPVHENDAHVIDVFAKIKCISPTVRLKFITYLFKFVGSESVKASERNTSATLNIAAASVCSRL